MRRWQSSRWRSTICFRREARIWRYIKLPYCLVPTAHLLMSRKNLPVRIFLPVMCGLGIWGGKDVPVTKVQYDVGRQNVIPFDKRDDPNAKPEPYQPVITGWRGTIVMPEQSQSDFADTFVWAFNKSGQTK